MSGGSVERAMNAWLVRPRGVPCSSTVVTIVTPLGKAPAISRNVARSTGTHPILDGMRGARFHYAWVVVAITFLALLVTSSVRAAPGVLITPLEQEYGWDRTAISAAIAVSILTFGLGGPLSGTLVGRFGPRKVILFGCSLVAAGLYAMLSLRDLWQFFAFWGVIVGVGTGAVGNVLGPPSRTAGSLAPRADPRRVRGGDVDGTAHLHPGDGLAHRHDRLARRDRASARRLDGRARPGRDLHA